MPAEIIECWDCFRAGRFTPAAEGDPNDLCADCNAAREADDAAASEAVFRHYVAMGWARADGREPGE